MADDRKDATPEPCRRCDGCGRLADTDGEEPWSEWLALPVGAAAAVLLGVVRPKPCPACRGRACDADCAEAIRARKKGGRRG